VRRCWRWCVNYEEWQCETKMYVVGDEQNGDDRRKQLPRPSRRLHQKRREETLPMKRDCAHAGGNDTIHDRTLVIRALKRYLWKPLPREHTAFTGAWLVLHAANELTRLGNQQPEQPRATTLKSGLYSFLRHIPVDSWMALSALSPQKKLLLVRVGGCVMGAINGSIHHDPACMPHNVHLHGGTGIRRIPSPTHFSTMLPYWVWVAVVC
jgi:hypothetical protein